MISPLKLTLSATTPSWLPCIIFCCRSRVLINFLVFVEVVHYWNIGHIIFSGIAVATFNIHFFAKQSTCYVVCSGFRLLLPASIYFQNTPKYLSRLNKKTVFLNTDLF